LFHSRIWADFLPGSPNWTQAHIVTGLDMSGPDIPCPTTESEAEDDLIGLFFLLEHTQDWEHNVRAKVDTISPTRSFPL
jgi:hypothetical protein